MTLTHEQLNAIKERADGATTGPWDWTLAQFKSDRYEVVEASYFLHPIVADDLPHKDDAIFIAHAREDIPALLAHIEALEDALTQSTALDDPKKIFKLGERCK